MSPSMTISPMRQKKRWLLTKRSHSSDSTTVPTERCIRDSLRTVSTITFARTGLNIAYTIFFACPAKCSDVYKRQEYCLRKAARKAFSSHAHQDSSHDRCLSSSSSHFLQVRLTSPAPVSYTHLDVYKRQTPEKERLIMQILQRKELIHHPEHRKN